MIYYVRILSDSDRGANRSIELAARRSLIQPHPPDSDVGAMVIFTLHRATGHASQHRDLAHVRQSVGDGTLEQLLRGFSERGIRSQISVESFERREETLYFLVPR